MAHPSGNSGQAGARFRQRKISVKVALPILKLRDIVNSENDLEPSQVNHLNSAQQPRDLHSIETGVDKNEEDEVHLQQVINAAQRALQGLAEEKKQDVYIPTPDASRLWKDAHKYYNDTPFKPPESYIKFSATVEDTVGVEYNMDEEDERFFNTTLKDYPKPKQGRRRDDEDNTRKCSELEFEIICDKFERVIDEKQPFLSMDLSNILSYEEISSIIMEEINSKDNTHNSLKYLSTSALKDKLLKELNFEPFVTLFDKNVEATDVSERVRPLPKLFDLFGRAVYEHWKKRKVSRKGRHIHPSLKFEDPNASEKDNDSDPYICFRRREFRQARKTRRADTVGSERIRLLQKSLHRARSLILDVAQREIIKAQVYESEHEIFKLRCDAKTHKRALGVKGDDHLFYPHKRKKTIRIRDDEDEREAKLRARKKEREEMAAASALVSVPRERYTNGLVSHVQPQETLSSTQPYVKLPPSKIPDMDLVTVSLVLKEKNETIKRAVLEKLRKRKDQDHGLVNVTDDAYQPFFNISTGDPAGKELSHMPYSSIAASSFHQINTSNYIDETLKKLVEEGKHPLPGIKTVRGSDGELVPSKPFPHLSTLINNRISKANTNGYVAQLFSNIESNNFSAYTHGYQQDNDTEGEVSGPIFRMRKRVGRANRLYVDRRGLFERPTEALEPLSKEGASGGTNVYDSGIDTLKRLDSRWKFDDDATAIEKGVQDPFCLDPSKLNCINEDTQSIRFGSMLLSKSYDLLRESVHQRQLLIQQARMRALQQQQHRQQAPKKDDHKSPLLASQTRKVGPA